MATEDQPIVAQQNVITNQSNTKTVFSFSALTMPTPDNIKAIFKVITFIVLISGVIANGVSDLPESVKQHILEYCVVTSLILQKAEDFWGIKITN